MILGVRQSGHKRMANAICEINWKVVQGDDEGLRVQVQMTVRWILGFAEVSAWYWRVDGR